MRWTDPTGKFIPVIVAGAVLAGKAIAASVSAYYAVLTGYEAGMAISDGCISAEEAAAVATNAAGAVGGAVAGKAIGHGVKVATNNVPPLTQIDDFVDLTAHRRAHILNGHLSGAGKSGKTEFPSNWDADRIMHQVSDVATDPNATRGLGKWDSPYAVATRDGIEIRVDFYPDLLPSGLPHPNAGKISTAYPTNTPVNP